MTDLEAAILAAATAMAASEIDRARSSLDGSHCQIAGLRDLLNAIDAWRVANISEETRDEYVSALRAMRRAERAASKAGRFFNRKEASELYDIAFPPETST